MVAKTTPFQVFRDRKAFTAWEYALIGAVIVLVLVVALPAIGSWLFGVFQDIQSKGFQS